MLFRSPTLEKLLEGWILKAMNGWMEECNLLSPHNHGGRRYFSTVTAKASMDSVISENIDLRCHSAVLGTDLSTAFDTVDHIALLCKLEHFGIRGDALKLFESYLNNRLQFVEIDTFRSSVLHSLPCSCIECSTLDLNVSISTNWSLIHLDQECATLSSMFMHRR